MTTALQTPETTALDPRAARTLQALNDALFTLLRNGTLAKVTVAQVCRTAEVHRTTFYGHYSSVQELAAAAFSTYIDQNSAVDPTEFVVAGADTSEVARLYREALRPLLAHILEHRNDYRLLFSDDLGNGFHQTLTERMADRVRASVAVWQGAGVATGVDAHLASRYIASGVVAALEVWAFDSSSDLESAHTRILEMLPAWWPR